MKERKPLMKKESKTKYIILIVFIVLALGYLAYDKSNINLKDIDLFKKDRTFNEGDVALASNNSLNDTLNSWESTTGSFMMLVLAVSLLGVAIAVFILPLFKGIGRVDGEYI